MEARAVRYFDIPNDAAILIVAADTAKSLMLRSRLQDLGFKNFSIHQRGQDLLKTLDGSSAALLYVVEAPRDMSWLTFVRALRTGKTFSSVPVVFMAPPAHKIGSEDRAFLASYHVMLLHARVDDEVKIAESVRAVFAARLDDQAVLTRLGAAKKLLQDGLKRRAAKLYEDLLALDEGSIVARYGLMMTKSPSSRQYWEQLSRLLALDPENYAFAFEAARRHARAGRIERATALVDRLTADLEKAGEAYWLNELGVICVGMRFFPMALLCVEHLREAVDRDTAWQPDLLLSRVHLASGDAAVAERWLATAKERATGRHAAIANLEAVIARRAGDFPKAIKLYESAMELSPDDHRLAYNAALCFLHCGNAEKAKHYCEKALSLHPDYARAKDLQASLASPRES